jgi:hypothetical protein
VLSFLKIELVNNESTVSSGPFHMKKEGKLLALTEVEILSFYQVLKQGLPHFLFLLEFHGMVRKQSTPKVTTNFLRKKFNNS